MSKSYRVLLGNTVFRVIGLGSRDLAAVESEVQAGARFVTFRYCCSAILITHVGESEVYYLRPGQWAAWRGLKYSLLTLIAGWWAFPHGPIHTALTVAHNTAGGQDVTAALMAAARQTRGAKAALDNLPSPEEQPDPAAFFRQMEQSQRQDRPPRG
jgi:hypothetical protein